MFSLIKWCFILFLACSDLLAKEASNTSSLTPKDKRILRVVAPYLPENVESNGKEGRDVEVFTSITKCMGLEVKIDVQPYMRHLKSYLTNKRYDGIMTIPFTVSKIDHKTENYIAYNNGVIVRQKDFPNGVNSIEDLKSSHIISFLGSKSLLKGISKKLHLFASYTETATQFRHNEMLMKKRVDGVFSDGLIFMAHQKRLLKKEPRWRDTKVKFYSLFSLSHFSAAFRDEKLVPLFNKCLSDLKKANVLQNIEKKYADKYDEILGKEYLTPLITN